MDVEEYSKYIQFYTEDIPELLLKYLNKIKWKIYLDLGCGDGALLYALNKKGYFDGKIVYAIDLSERRISLAKRIDKDFRCFVDDACNIQTIKDNSIDFLVSAHVVEHVTNDEAIVREISRVLNKNGTVYLATVFKKWYGWFYKRCNGKWTLDYTHLREYTQDYQLFDLLRRYDLEILETKKSVFSLSVTDAVFKKIFRRSTKRDVYNNRLLRLLRNFKVPIFGYQEWETVCQKE
ncbi:MAG: class I SAM-dependent methyltransferase [Promethearchaeota archaeon]